MSETELTNKITAILDILEDFHPKEDAKKIAKCDRVASLLLAQLMQINGPVFVQGKK